MLGMLSHLDPSLGSPSPLPPSCSDDLALTASAACDNPTEPIRSSRRQTSRWTASIVFHARGQTLVHVLVHRNKLPPVAVPVHAATPRSCQAGPEQ